MLTQPTVARGQLLRPYPQFTDIIPLYAAGAKSRYDALQITGRKRMSHGLMFEGSYTFAKAREIGMNHQDSYDIEASWALASYDITHRFVISYLYELPFGRNRRFASGASPLVNAIIGGWQFNGITTLQSGTPLSITANNTAGIFGARTQPNNNGSDPRLDGPVKIGSIATSTRASTASRRRSRSATSRSFRRCSGPTACGTSTSRSSRTSSSGRRHDGAVPHRGDQRVQHGAVLGTQHQRDVDVVRRDHRSGERAEAAAVRPEVVVVREPRPSMPATETFQGGRLLIASNDMFTRFAESLRMRARMKKLAVVVLASLFVLPASLRTAQLPEGPDTRLILLVAVDQFRYDYLTRFRSDTPTGSSGSSPTAPSSRMPISSTIQR